MSVLVAKRILEHARAHDLDPEEREVAALARAYLEAEKALRTMLNLAADWVAHGTTGNIASLIEIGEAALAEHEPERSET